MGGGAFDAAPIPDSMYQSWEIETQNFSVSERCKLKYPRHGHTLARIQSKFIYCIGTRKDMSDCSKSVEVYNVSLDLWYEIASLNEGRHYHSACTFEERFLYVFCGISNDSKKYINTVERFDHN